MSLTSICTACPVQRGQCPNCGTFWIEQGGKRYGVGVREGPGSPSRFISQGYASADHQFLAAFFQQASERETT